MKCVGIKYLDFPDKNDPSKRVTGVRVIGAYEITKNGEGVDFEKIFLSEWFISNRLGGAIPKVGDHYEVTYNRFGKLDDLRVVAPAAK